MRIVSHCLDLWIHQYEYGEDEEEAGNASCKYEHLAEFWDAEKYGIDPDPPIDKTKIPLQSPLEPGLSEADAQDIVDTFGEYLCVDRPAEYLKLLRITDSVCGAGSYNKEVGSRQQTSPFSN